VKSVTTILTMIASVLNVITGLNGKRSDLSALWGAFLIPIHSLAACASGTNRSYARVASLILLKSIIRQSGNDKFLQTYDYGDTVLVFSTYTM
jgi:hypothetical protein